MDSSASRRAAGAMRHAEDQSLRRAAWARTLSQVEENDPALTRLEVRIVNERIALPSVFYWPSDSDHLARLCEAIGANTNIRTLKINATHDDITYIAANKGPFFEGLKCNTSICHLEFIRFDLSTGAGIDLFNDFVTNVSNLKNIALSEWSLRNGGAGILTPALQKCTNLKRIGLSYCNGDGQLVEFVSGVRELRQLRSLSLIERNLRGADCEALATLLQDPSLNLRSLCVSVVGNRSLAMTVQQFSQTLKGNLKLERLRLRASTITEIGWNAFSQVLCNTSSINATYHSNHTLSSITGKGRRAPRGLQTKISSLLRMNGGDDKQQVAIRKILCHHTHLDMEPLFEWDLTVLPVAVRWFDQARNSVPEITGAKVDARKLSAMYQFARSMPLNFIPYGGGAAEGRAAPDADAVKAAVENARSAVLDPALSHSRAVQHGCTKDVRDMYLETLAEIPTSEVDLHKKLLEHKHIDPGENTSRPRTKRKANVENDGKPKKRRYYERKNMRRTNTHLDGTDIGAMLARAVEKQSQEKAVGAGGMK